MTGDEPQRVYRVELPHEIISVRADGYWKAFGVVTFWRSVGAGRTRTVAEFKLDHVVCIVDALFERGRIAVDRAINPVRVTPGAGKVEP